MINSSYLWSKGSQETHSKYVCSVSVLLLQENRHVQLYNRASLAFVIPKIGCINMHAACSNSRSGGHLLQLTQPRGLRAPGHQAWWSGQKTRRSLPPVCRFKSGGNPGLVGWTLKCSLFCFSSSGEGRILSNTYFLTK